MPKIFINEVDLTTPSNQPSLTDIVYVPGYSIKENVTHDLVFCNTIKKFEDEFGTAPKKIVRDIEFSVRTGSQTYATGNFDIQGSVDGDKFRQNYPGFGETDESEKDCALVLTSAGNTFDIKPTTESATVAVTKTVANTAEQLKQWGFNLSGDIYGFDNGLKGGRSDGRAIDYVPKIYSKSETSNRKIVEYYVDIDTFIQWSSALMHTETPVVTDTKPIPRVVFTNVGGEWKAKFDDIDETYTLGGSKKQNASLATVGVHITFNDGSEPISTDIVTMEMLCPYPDETTGNDALSLHVNSLNDFDLSYVYAKELIRAGLPVVYQVVSDSNIYNESDFSNVFDATSSEGICDKGEFSIKYITSGAYHSFNFTTTEETDGGGNAYVKYIPNGFWKRMIDVAKGPMRDTEFGRGDCVAIIDADPDVSGAWNSDKTPGCSLVEDYSLWKAAQSVFSTESGTEFATMFTPWCKFSTGASYYKVTPTGKERVRESYDSKMYSKDLSWVILPGSFAYLITLANSIRVNPNWYAVAGISRGQVKNVVEPYTKRRLSNTIANTMQPRNGKTSINCITDIKPYGQTIWGNRTLKNNMSDGEDGLVATSFLNTRNMVSDIKKLAYNAAKGLMFEQNSDVLWVNFIAKICPFLDKLKSGQGLSNYKVVRERLTADGYRLPKAKLRATIRIWPIYAVEEFEITIELNDEDVSVQ